jgi:DNA-binding response OmpR family regulator
VFFVGRLALAAMSRKGSSCNHVNQPLASGRLALLREGGVQHVLVVDDQPDVCAMMQMVLEELAGFRVSLATTGAAALVLVESAIPLDVLILDVVLPDLSGFELAVAALRRGLPVLMMTGSPAAAQQLAHAKWPYLKKPFHLEDLFAQVRICLEQARENQRMVRSSLARLLRTRSADDSVAKRVRLAIRGSRPLR